MHCIFVKSDNALSEAPWEDEDDDEVADGGEEHQHGHHIPVHRLDKVKRAQEGARIDHIAGRGKQTTEIKFVCVFKTISHKH